MIQNTLQSIYNYIQYIQPKQTFELSKFKLIEDSLIAEGGYGYIYKVLDQSNPKQEFALKEIRIQDKQTRVMAQKEQLIMQQLGKHENIVQLVDSRFIEGKDQQKMLLLFELCEGGTLLDILQKKLNAGKPLVEKEIVQIIKQVIKGIKHIHKQNITHRDIKIENMLIQNKVIKICDFGSASQENFDFTKASKLEISKQLEQFEKYTTLMYRPPEMLDQYSGYSKVNQKVDIWMLGCVLYLLCYQKHPFQDAQKLAILNGQYLMPYERECLSDIIRNMLTPNPELRPDIFELDRIFQNFDQIKQNKQIVLNNDTQNLKELQLEQQQNKNQIFQKVQKQEKKKKNKSYDQVQTKDDSDDEKKWDQFSFDEKIEEDIKIKFDQSPQKEEEEDKNNSDNSDDDENPNMFKQIKSIQNKKQQERLGIRLCQGINFEGQNICSRTGEWVKGIFNFNT